MSVNTTGSDAKGHSRDCDELLVDVVEHPDFVFSSDAKATQGIATAFTFWFTRLTSLLFRCERPLKGLRLVLGRRADELHGQAMFRYERPLKGLRQVTAVFGGAEKDGVPMRKATQGIATSSLSAS